MAGIHNILSGAFVSSSAPAGFAVSVSYDQQNLDLRTWALANGWNGTEAVVATIEQSVFVFASNIYTPALTIGGSWPNGITLINNGFIIGAGGNGGGVFQCSESYPGGPALSVDTTCTIQNNSYICGGGGGGGGGLFGGGGGGAGGGAGGGYPGWVNGGAGGSMPNFGGYNGDDAFTSGSSGDIWLGGGGGGGRVVVMSSGGYGGNSVYRSQFGGGGGQAGGGGGGAASYYYGNLQWSDSGGEGGSDNWEAGFGGGYAGYGGAGWGAMGTPTYGITQNTPHGGAAVQGVSNVTWSEMGTLWGPLV